MSGKVGVGLFEFGEKGGLKRWNEEGSVGGWGGVGFGELVPEGAQLGEGEGFAPFEGCSA